MSRIMTRFADPAQPCPGVQPYAIDPETAERPWNWTEHVIGVVR
jgi:hypothetical protein